MTDVSLTDEEAQAFVDELNELCRKHLAELWGPHDAFLFVGSNAPHKLGFQRHGKEFYLTIKPDEASE